MQVVGYKWKGSTLRGWEPQLVVENKGSLDRVPVLGNIDVSIGERLCAGYTSGGRYFPCPHGAKTSSGWRCDSCKKMDDYFYCIQCSGNCINNKQRSACRESGYFVYLAAFDSTIKVGISHERRFFERLVEQGADFAAKIAFMKDGMAVRKAEQNVKKILNCTDRMRGNEKNDRLFGNPNASVMQISKSIAVLKDQFETNTMEIYDLRRFYGLENVKKRPRMIKVRDQLNISGKVVAAKGNLMVIKNGFFYTLNAHDIIGREIAFNT